MLLHTLLAKTCFARPNCWWNGTSLREQVGTSCEWNQKKSTDFAADDTKTIFQQNAPPVQHQPRHPLLKEFEKTTPPQVKPARFRMILVFSSWPLHLALQMLCGVCFGLPLWCVRYIVTHLFGHLPIFFMSPPNVPISNLNLANYVVTKSDPRRQPWTPTQSNFSSLPLPFTAWIWRAIQSATRVPLQSPHFYSGLNVGCAFWRFEVSCVALGMRRRIRSSLF